MAPPPDLREWIALLEREGELVRVAAEVDPELEITEINDRTVKSGGPALLFENVKGYPGWRVLGGLFATRKLVALGLGVPQEQMLERYLTLEDKRIAPEIVLSAPCKEIKWTGDQIDSYGRLDLRLARSLRLGGSRAEFSATVQNATDRHYVDFRNENIAGLFHSLHVLGREQLLYES